MSAPEQRADQSDHHQWQQVAQAGQRLEAYTPIYRIARLDPLWLEIQVPLARAAGVREGARVRVPSVEASREPLGH